ncbi:MAG: S-methyl-5-thioribose-1-phosphate isomerase, partial [Candidatus Polarisedimenticolia bacterium]
MIEPVRLLDDAVELLDQRLLPREERYVRCADAAAVAAAIKEMVVRGAPAIGVAAAGGVALAALAARERPAEGFLSAIDAAVQEVVAARPTAVNPRVAAKRVASAAREALEAGDEPAAAAAAALAAARAVRDEDLAANQEMGKNGAMLVPDGARILTHCNAGALATAGFGTALGVVRAA